jgi:uncharacterized membrane protein (UPF0127 family)
MKTINSYFVANRKTEGLTTLGDIDDAINSDKKKPITLFRTENVIERTAGLLTLLPLDKGQGLLINKCNSIHTVGMHYALDVVYLNRQLNVVKLVKNIKPARMSFSLRAKHTLELLAGEINRIGIKEGMTLVCDEK